MISFVLFPQASQPSTNFYNIGIGLFIPFSFSIILSLLLLIIFVVFPSPLPSQFYCFPSPPPPPPHFYFVPASYYQLVHFVALSHVVKNNPGFLQQLAVCPAQDPTIQMAARTSKNNNNNNRFNEQNNKIARAAHFFCTFLSRLCTTKTSKCLISCFKDNKQRQNFISFSKLRYGPLGFNFRRVHLHLRK